MQDLPEFDAKQIEAAAAQVKSAVQLDGATLVHARKSAASLLAAFMPAEQAERLAELGAKEFQKTTVHLPWPDYHNLAEDGWYPGPSSNPMLSKFWRGLEPSLPPASAASIDERSSDIVSRLENPAGTREIATRGLVLGNVQSGKTTSYMSVIAKAADAGYKIFVVLTGMTNSLREQTQFRLENQLLRPTWAHWYRLTTCESDFRGDNNSHSVLNMTKDNMRVIAIVKKNAVVLRRLNKWLDEAPKQLLDATPILVIDDEADQGSVNTKDDAVSAINNEVRKIIGRRRVSYVAYTATPFANLLIDPTNLDDLYPRSFVRTLPVSDQYFGSERLFGRSAVEEFGKPQGKPMPLLPQVDVDRIRQEILHRLLDTKVIDEAQIPWIEGYSPSGDGHLAARESVAPDVDAIRIISDAEAEAVRPPGSKALETWTPVRGQALEEAVRWFLLGTAARRQRERKTSHSTMLVHTAMYAMAHQETARLVGEIVGDLQRRIGEEDPALLEQLRTQWNDEQASNSPDDFGQDHIDFDFLLPRLSQTSRAVRVITDNYFSEDRLEYSASSPQTVIVIGGNTLSRGLTLEGLMSSYFVRNASAYDTLLQMGRWFGYRPGWEDLPRIWMTEEMTVWFRDLALVEHELRADIDQYLALGATPAELGTLIRVHPAMSVTSAAKMRHAKKLRLDFAGKRPQMTLFEIEDSATLDAAKRAADRLVENADKSGASFERFIGGPGFSGVPLRVVREFLETYPRPRDLSDFPIASMLEYFDKYAGDSVDVWNVVFVSPQSRSKPVVRPGVKFPEPIGEQVTLVSRSRMKHFRAGLADIRSLMSGDDNVADTPDRLATTYTVYQAFEGLDALVTGTDSVGVVRALNWRQAYLDGRPALVIYVIDADSKAAASSKLRVDLGAQAHLIGAAAVFPKTSKGGHFVVAKVDDLVEAPTAEDGQYQDPLAAAAWEDARDEVAQVNEAEEQAESGSDVEGEEDA